MSSIKLIFRNASQDVNDTTVVLFQRNQDKSTNDNAIAWKAIEHCGVGEWHPFDYPMSQQVSVIDAWGNYSPLLDANNGDVFSVTDAGGKTGNVLAKTSEIGDPNLITVRNDLPTGSIDIAIFKDGRRLALETGVSPGGESVFGLHPALDIGTSTDVKEGDVMDSDTVPSNFTQLSLLGLKSADIVLTGGGTGPLATPYVFSLSNQKY